MFQEIQQAREIPKKNVFVSETKQAT